MIMMDIKTKYKSVELFCDDTAALLQLERDAEIMESSSSLENVSFKLLQKRGVCLTKLNIDSRKTGLYGRQVLTFAPNNVNRPELPATSITPGDIVGLHTTQQSAHIASGVVLRVARTCLTVAFEQCEELSTLGDDVCHLVKLANDVTHKRLKRALDRLRTYRNGVASSLIEILFNQKPNPQPLDKPSGTLKMFNENLDESQCRAVYSSLNQRHLSIIHGPPGTGKTTTVVEVIRQLVFRGLKVLACAPSNVAVDNLAMRLADTKTRVVRLGHPARAMADIQKYSLDAQISASDESSIVDDVKRDIDETLKKMRKSGKNGGEKQSLRNELKVLRKELRERSDTAVSRVLKNSAVVLSTLTSATDDGPLKVLEDMHFDVVVIDECSQATEAACWIPLTQAPKCVLAGDHHQLPPTIISNKAAKDGLAITLMERLIDSHKECVQMLTVQYRMHENIMTWASKELYGGKLTAHSSVANHRLCDLPNVECCEETETVLMLIDTASCDLLELDLPDELSKGNEGEADLVAAHTEKLISTGLKPQDIAVISPYNLQVELIRGRLMEKYPQLEVKSVDGYQGREKEAVIISLVRSNCRGEVGFLSEDRRLNVAVTRARRHVAVICNSDTVKQHAFLFRLVEHFNLYGLVRSAAVYQQDYEIGDTSSESNQFLQTLLQAKSLPKTKPTSKVKPQPQKNSSFANTGKHNQMKVQVNETAAEEKVVETEAEREQRIRGELNGIVSSFKYESEKQSFAFPSTLNSYERMIVHQIAEEFSLIHISVGVGKERCIKLHKRSSTPPLDTAQSNDEQEKTTPASVEEKITTSSTQETKTGARDLKENSSKSSKKKKKRAADKQSDDTEELAILELKCDLCGSNVPASNMDIHQMRCERVHASDTVLENINSESLQKSRKVKQKTGKSGSSKTRSVVEALDKADPDDFDAMLAAVDKMDSVCNFRKCKALVRTIGTTCLHCKLRFCLNHGMPEIHGCGDAAKQNARQTVIREGRIYNGSGVPDKKPSADRRAQLERKLNKKMDEYSGQRKPKSDKSH